MNKLRILCADSNEVGICENLTKEYIEQAKEHNFILLVDVTDLKARLLQLKEKLKQRRYTANYPITSVYSECEREINKLLKELKE